MTRRPQVAILELLREGHFGGVRPGDSREQVRARLGPPDDHSARVPAERAEIWRYATVELHFYPDGRLRSIWCDYLPLDLESEHIDLDPWLFGDAETTRPVVETALRVEGIFFRVDGDQGNDDVPVLLRFPSGAEVGFGRRDEPVLISCAALG